MAKFTLLSFSSEQQQELAKWVETDVFKDLPPSASIAIRNFQALAAVVTQQQHRFLGLLAEFRRALGITPSSERRTSGKVLSATSMHDGRRAKNKLEKLKLSEKRSERLAEWHQTMARKYKHNARNAKNKIMKIEDTIELTEEEQKIEQAEIKQYTKAYRGRLELGGRVAEPALMSPEEAFRVGGTLTVEESTQKLSVPPEEIQDAHVVGRFEEERERYDVTLSVKKITLQVEKVVVETPEGNRRVVTASTEEFGPPGYAVTWDFIVTLITLVAQYAMPLNRLGMLLSGPCKCFTSAFMARLFHYAARRFAPIYIQLFENLCDSDILQGDDTPTRVLGVTRHYRNVSQDETLHPPWRSYANQEAASQNNTPTSDSELGALLARELGFEFERKDGKGSKRQLNTTTLLGRQEALDPRSQIIFYRSHFGSFGNLLEMLLKNRTPEKNKITIQSDLATTNLIVDAELNKRFEVMHLGCASHARRIFALYENDDILCTYILHLFKGLAMHENDLNLFGRNYENTPAVRNIDSRLLWEDIKEYSELLTERWSRETKIGEGAYYILRNYKKLTAYLDNPHVLSPSNNFSERMLRMEKLIEANSQFRVSLEGRFALDVIRSVLQTAVAARVPLQEYLLHVLRASPEDISNSPERYTPFAYARSLEAPSASNAA